MLSDIIKNSYNHPGASGLPEHYPVPPADDKLMFYIQKNQNFNTVAYELNLHQNGDLNKDYPLHPYWIKYTDGGEIKELNFYQNKLAYGYKSKKINADTFEFQFVSYKDITFYLAKTKQDVFKVHCTINNEMSVLNNIYVYAEEFGVFPSVKFIEFYGQKINSDMYTYQKILIEG